MRTHRMLTSLLPALSVAALLWQAPVNADTLGNYQPTALRKAEAALQHGQTDHALALLQGRAAEMRRWGAEAQANDLMCQAWFEKGDYVKAERSCDAAVLAGGEATWNHVYHRGVMRLLLGRVEEGIADLRKASSMSPDSAAVPTELAVAERF
jgi:tetratricopeptide (TPR) repeat protein